MLVISRLASGSGLNRNVLTLKSMIQFTRDSNAGKKEPNKFTKQDMKLEEQNGTHEMTSS